MATKKPMPKTRSSALDRPGMTPHELMEAQGFPLPMHLTGLTDQQREWIRDALYEKAARLNDLSRAVSREGLAEDARKPLDQRAELLRKLAERI